MNGRVRLVAILLALLMLGMAVGVAGCGSDAEEPIDEDTTLETGEGGIGETMLTGEELVEAKCSTCHDLERVLEADYDDVGWMAVIDRMIVNGLEITDEEAAAVAQYLANR